MKTVTNVFYIFNEAMKHREYEGKVNFGEGYSHCYVCFLKRLHR